VPDESAFLLEFCELQIPRFARNDSQRYFLRDQVAAIAALTFSPPLYFRFLVGPCWGC